MSAFLVLMAELEELLKKKEKVERKLAEIKLRFGHAHLDFMSVHDLAETEFGSTVPI